jgi:hypothetical protein
VRAGEQEAEDLVTDRTRYRLVLEALPDDPAGREPWYRLKVALKTLLRRDRLRAVSVEEVRPAPAPAPPTTPTKGR